MSDRIHTIGGYPSLELPLKEQHFHSSAIRLNTGRNALEYILRTTPQTKIYIPYYTCEAVVEPINKLNLSYEFYHINLQFEMCNEISLKKDEVLLYTNYWGLKNEYCQKLANKYRDHLIIDNSQAFYASPVNGIPTFYSPRKFFGVSDGAYLYNVPQLNAQLSQDKSTERMKYLIQRIDEGAMAGYATFQASEEELTDQPIKEMSAVTSRILGSIDYETIAKARRRNFSSLLQHLNSSNLIRPILSPNDVPLTYPYLSSNKDLRSILIDNNIFVPRYWQNVLNWVSEDSVEYQLASNLLPLPIGQTYSIEDMIKIIEIIKKYA